MNIKRRIQLLMQGEPDRPVRDAYVYMGIDLGVREISVAVIGHMVGENFHIIHIHDWDTADYDGHLNQITSLIDAYDPILVWVDSHQSAPLAQVIPRLQRITNTSHMSRQYDEFVRQIAHHQVRPTGYMIPGKPKYFFANVLDQLRAVPMEIESTDPEKDQYVHAFRTLLWGIAHERARGTLQTR